MFVNTLYSTRFYFTDTTVIDQFTALLKLTYSTHGDQKLR